MVAGCAITDEGAVSYRIAEPLPPGKRSSRIDEIHEQSIVLTTSNPNLLVDPVMPLRLARQDLGMPSAAIRNGDSITVRLRHVYVNDCSAFPFSPQRVFSNFAIARPNCEEAVLVNAFEMTKGKSFPIGPTAKNDARVIFFSTDVEGGNALGAEGQNLNFDNMPIYGPITYNGGPFALDLYVIEIDAETPQIKALLGTLASLGSIVYAPASPALGVLNTIGGALLDGEQDDTDFRFSAVFDSYPDTVEDPQGHAWLEEGNYVFVREQDRQQQTPWTELLFDDNTGKIYKKAADDSNSREEYRDNTYIVIQILKNLPAKDIDQQQVLFSDFRADLKARAEAEAELIKTAANAVAKDLTHIANFDAARQALNSIEKYCARKKRGDVRSDADADAKRHAFDLVGLIAARAPAQGDKEQPSLSPEQVQILLRRMRVLANPTDDAALQLYSAPKVAEWNAQDKTAVRAGVLSCGGQ